MVKPSPTKTKEETFWVPVDKQHAITLPVEVRRRLGIPFRGAVEITLHDDHATIRKAPDEPVPELQGLLSDYFKDMEDVNRFIEQERHGCQDQEERWSRAAELDPEQNGTFNTSSV